MAYFDLAWYCNAGDQSTTGHYAVTKWATGATIAAGALRRQLAAPAVGNERVFVAIVAGTTHATTEPTWVLTRGAKTTDNTVTWQECTGISAVNGDLTNTLSWTGVTGGIATAITLGVIIQRNNGASYWICSTAGSTGTTEPGWANNTAGTTQTDSGVTWTCLGVVGNFTGGQAPHARLANVFGTNWYIVGNTVYIGDNHAESQSANLNITVPGSTAGLTGRIICHNHLGSYPPASGNLATGAIIQTNGAWPITFIANGAVYVYGLTFKCSTATSGNSPLNIMAATPANLSWLYLDNCSLQIATSGFGNSQIYLGSSTIGSHGAIILNNTTVSFGNVAQSIWLQQVQLIWRNTGAILAGGSSVPTSLLAPNVNGGLNNVVLEALDLSQITGTLIANNNSGIGSVLIKDCKLNASATISTPTNSEMTHQLVRSDSGGTAYKSARYVFEGTETTDTSVTRVGGATDPTGQVQSRRIVTTAFSQWLRPFKAEPYAIWNPTTAANVTVTVYGTINLAALPNNDDIWIEAEYLGSSASPLGTIVNTTKTNLFAANAAVASDASTWNNAPTSAAFATLDGAATNATLSNGNLTATHSNTTIDSGARSTLVETIGQFYFEVTINNTPTVGDCWGVIQNAAAYHAPVTSGASCCAAYGSGNVYSNNILQGSALLGAFAAGDKLSAAIDLTNGMCWFRKNGGLWNASSAANPATNTGGFPIQTPSVGYVPFVGFYTGGSGNNVTFNFGATSYTYTPPSGFGNWAIIWTPFKLVATLSSPQPGIAGIIEARIRAAKPGITFCIDPKPDVTGAAVSSSHVAADGSIASERAVGGFVAKGPTIAGRGAPY